MLSMYIPPSLLILLSGPASTAVGLGILFIVAGRTGLETSSSVFAAWFVGTAFLMILVPAALLAAVTAVLNFDGFPPRRTKRDLGPIDIGHLAVVTPIR